MYLLCINTAEQLLYEFMTFCHYHHSVKNLYSSCHTELYTLCMTEYCCYVSVCLTLQSVIKNGIDPNGEDSIGNTPAHLAAAEGHLECLKVLVYHRKQPLEVVTYRNNNVSDNKQNSHSV